MLQNVKKTFLSINKYLSKVKNFVDRLASAGHIVTAPDHSEAIFNSLHKNTTLLLSLSIQDLKYTLWKKLNHFF